MLELDIRHVYEIVVLSIGILELWPKPCFVSVHP